MKQIPPAQASELLRCLRRPQPQATAARGRVQRTLAEKQLVRFYTYEDDALCALTGHGQLVAAELAKEQTK